MLTFLVRRLAAAMAMVAIAATLVFFLIHMLPGDPIVLLLGEQGASNPDVVRRIREKLNLDAPIPVQYARWLERTLRGDLGESLQTGLPVSGEVAKRIPRSLELIALGLLFATAVGIPLGVLAAQRPNAPSGWLAAGVAVFGFSSPNFVTGILLIIAFSLWTGLLPSSGYAAPSEGVARHLHFALLPSLTIGLNFMGVVTRMTRASLGDVLRKDYVRTARAKGLAERAALYRHALPNALIPIIAVIGVRAGNLLGGMVIIEALFDWPGLSSLLVRACFDRDYPIIQGALLAILLLFVVISLVVDFCQSLVDPKLRQVWGGGRSATMERRGFTGTGRLLFAIPFLFLLGSTALLAHLLAPHDPLAIDARNILQVPSTTHLFGTDELGRDILSRLMYGARISLSIAAAAVAIASVIGVIVGIVASHAGGHVENLVMRVIDIFVCLPEIFVAIVVMAFLEHGLRTLIITIGLLYFPQFARVAYNVARSLREKEYVLAAVSLGAGPFHIIARALVPNMASVIVVQVSFTLSFAMLLEAGLSFLGLGLMPPAPSWGQMVGTLKDYLFTNAWPVVFPSLALFSTIFAINTLGDWLQDYLNPEMPR